jgi:hypothetical protein
MVTLKIIWGIEKLFNKQCNENCSYRNNETGSVPHTIYKNKF